MDIGRKAWLIYNKASGSNDEAALAALVDAISAAGFDLPQRRCFPEEGVPTPAELRDSACDLLIVFAGDGTISSTVTGLYGWDGKVLVLPGGTMNMLSRRLHGEAGQLEIIRRLADGQAKAARPTVIRTQYGDALTGILAGPGTVWNDVREAMRRIDLIGTVSTVSEAIGVSTSGARVFCAEPRCGREAGYAAIALNPHDDGLSGDGYVSETFGELAMQGFALLQREFRDGPHDVLGKKRSWRLASAEGEPMGLLIDGEPFDGAPEEVFTLARCEVDLLATAHAA